MPLRLVVFVVFVIFVFVFGGGGSVEAVGRGLCMNPATGAVSASAATGCIGGWPGFKQAGVNIYDVFWNAWEPSESSGNLTTSQAAMAAAAAYNLTFVRAFAHPFTYGAQYDWLQLSPAAKEAFFHPSDAVVAAAEALGMHLVPSLGYGCARAEPCNPALLYNESFRT